MKIIDFHTHVFTPEQVADRARLAQRDQWFSRLYGSPDARMATVDTLLKAERAASVSRSVVFSFPWQDPALLRESNDYVFAAAADHPDEIIPFLTLSPGDNSSTEQELLRTRPVPPRGIGELMPDGNGFRLRDPSIMTPVARFAVDHGLPILTHTSEPFGHLYPGKGRTFAEEVLELARLFPQLVIVCGHWGGGLIFYELQPELAADLKNVHYDTSASCFLYRNAIFQVAAAICPRKVLFGSDYPACPLKRQLRALREADIPNDVRQHFLWVNAERLLAHSHRSR